VCAQTFTYSGYIRNADGTGAVNVPVKLYKRTTPVMTGFTSQNNYNGHSYYRSTGTAIWTTARQNCVNMGGHLVTVTTAAENSENHTHIHLGMAANLTMQVMKIIFSL